MKEIEKHLLNNEKVLWHRCTVVNLLRFIPQAVFIIVLIIIILISLLTILQSLIEIVFYSCVFITVIGVLLGLYINQYKKMKKVLKVSSTELKSYTIYDVLTNKRFIRMNYILNFHENIDFSVYPLNALYSNEDIMFLDLNFVEIVYVDRLKQNFQFWVNLSPDKYAKTMALEYFTQAEYGKIIDTLSDILSLEVFDRSPEFIKFHKKES